jgi:hypothetical protein
LKKWREVKRAYFKGVVGSVRIMFNHYEKIKIVDNSPVREAYIVKIRFDNQPPPHYKEAS